MKAITDIEEAMALPERSQMENEIVTLEDGRKCIIPHFREIVAVDLEDDAILFFVDTDDRRMSIGYDAEGAYKYAI